MHKQIVEDSFLLTLRTLFDAPASSPLASIDANNVAAFLVQLTMADERSAAKNSTTSVAASQSEDEHCHDSLAVALCNEILREPHAFHARILCRTLTLLHVSPRNYATLKQLHALAEELRQVSCYYFSCFLFSGFMVSLEIYCKGFQASTTLHFVSGVRQ